MHMKRRQFLSAALVPLIPTRAMGAFVEPLFAFGDSITLASPGGASAPAKGYAALAAAAKGWQLVNTGISGAQIADMADPVMRRIVNADSRSIGLVGFNDNYVRGLPGIEPCAETLKALAAWLGIPESRKLRGVSPAIGYAGSWQLVGAYGATMGRVASYAGDTARFIASGSTIYVALTRFAVGSHGGAVSIAVDGRQAGTWSCEGGQNSYLGTWHSPMLARIPGLSAGEHEVVVTVTAGYVTLLWAAGLGGDTCAARPAVYVGNCLRLDATGYGWGTAGANDSTVAAYNAAILAATDTLRADGLNVVYVDACAAYDPALYIAADHTHPNDQGHARIAQAYLALM